MLNQQHNLQMVLRQLKDTHKYLIDDKGKPKTGQALEEALSKKVESQINEAGAHLDRFMNMADCQTRERIDEKNGTHYLT